MIYVIFSSWYQTSGKIDARFATDDNNWEAMQIWQPPGRDVKKSLEQ